MHYAGNLAMCLGNANDTMVAILIDLKGFVDGMA